MRIVLPLLLGVLAQQPLDAGPEERSSTNKTEAAHSAEALKLTQQAAEQYELTLNSDGRTKLELQTKPILRWSNPVAGSIYGNVFVWTHQGRPEAVASIFKWYSPFTHMSHEFHSLSVGTIKAKRRGKLVWQPAGSGVEFADVPDAPLPAKTAARRLQRMRTFARQFTARKTDREDVSRDLRLLTQPVFRYKSPKRGVLDGAMFVFVQGTDPEIWLLIEARQTDKGHQWQYAVARMNSVKFVVKHQRREVWRVEIMPWRNVYKHQEPYTSFRQNQPNK